MKSHTRERELKHSSHDRPQLQSVILLVVLGCLGSARAGAVPLLPYGAAAAAYDGGLALDNYHGIGAATPIYAPAAHGKLVYGAPALAYQQPLAAYGNAVYGGYPAVYGGHGHYAGEYEHHDDDGHHGDHHVSL